MAENNTIDIQFLGRQLDRVLDEQRAMRREVADIRTLVIALAEQNRRLDRRLTEMTADLELMIKSEIGGGMANTETRLEQRLDRSIEALVDRLSRKIGPLDD